jgi:hypothetical protein
MVLHAFLNELSCAEPIEERDANKALATFVDVLREIVHWRKDLKLICHVNFTSLELARGYYHNQWVAADPRNRDRWLFLRSRQNIAPPGSGSFDIPEDREYYHNGQRTEGLGRANEHSGIGLSLPVNPAWSTSKIILTLVTLADPDKSIEVYHAAEIRHVRSLEVWLQEPPHLPVISEGRRYYHRDFHMIIECRVARFFYSKDTTRHGGSAFKGFTMRADGLHWDADLDEHGIVIEGKHKGPTGLFIPKGELRAVLCVSALSRRQDWKGGALTRFELISMLPLSLVVARGRLRKGGRGV